MGHRVHERNIPGRWLRVVPRQRASAFGHSGITWQGPIIGDTLAALPPDLQRKVLHDNAADLYKIET